MASPAFPAELLRPMMDKTRVYRDIHDHISHVFVTVDPAAGGSKSRWVLISCIYPKRGEMVVSRVSFFQFHSDIFCFFALLCFFSLLRFFFFPFESPC
jgi:hypothetical protein